MNKFFNFFVALILMAMTMAPKAMSQMVQPFPGSLFPSTENLPIGNASDEAALVALIGNDVYGNFQHGALFYVANGKLTYQQIGGETFVLSGSATLYKDDNLYVYKYENEGVAFKTQNGAIKEVVFKKSNYSPYAYKHIEFNESDLAAMMGEKVYVSEDEENFPATISVVNNKICMIAENQTIELSTVCSKMYKEGDVFVMADESDRYIFYITRKTISSISYYNNQDVTDFNALATEARIANVLGNSIFALPSAQASLSAEGNHVILVVGGEKQNLESYQMYDYGSSIEIMNQSIRIDITVNNNMAKDVSYYNGQIYDHMKETTLEKELASLMGENEYVNVNENTKIYLDFGGHIYLDYGEGGFYFIDNEYALSKDGNNYVFNGPFVTVTFIVEKGQVAWVEAKSFEGTSTYSILADEEDLIALMGENKYVSIGRPGTISVQNGAIYMMSESGQQTMGFFFNQQYHLYKRGDNYIYTPKIIGNNYGIPINNVGFTFVVENSKVSKVVFDSPVESSIFVNLAEMTPVDEKDLVALMGNNAYVCREANDNTISVVNGHIYIGQEGQGVNLSDVFKLYRIEDNYVFIGDHNFVFVVKNNQVAMVIDYSDSQMYYVLPADDSELLTLIGDNTYYSTLGNQISVENGEILMKDGQQTNDCISCNYTFIKDGDNYVYLNGGEKYTFVIENGQLARIEHIIPWEDSETFLRPAEEAELVPLMGENEYTGMFISIYVRDNHIIASSQMQQGQETPLIQMANLLKDGNNYLFSNPANSYRFVVENGQVTKIEYEGMPFSFTLYATVDNAQLLALIGDDEYISKYDERIYSSNGNVALYDGDEETYLNYDFTLHKDGENYVYELDGAPAVSFTFIVNNGKLISIDFKNMDKAYSFINKLATSIKKVNTTKEKAIKTIKNGRIVIIKGNDIYDLSGRKIK